MDLKDPRQIDSVRLKGCKELAGIFGVHISMIRAMRRAGAPFLGRLCRPCELAVWWKARPGFRRRHAPLTREIRETLGR